MPGYIDEGLSGISTKKRENFHRMIDDAKAGKFDLILTKESLHEPEDQMQSDEEFHKHITNIRTVMREAQKCVESGFVTKGFVDQYINKIFVTPVETLTAATTFGDGVRLGQKSNEKQEASEEQCH